MKTIDIWTGDVLGRKEDADYLQKYLVRRYEAKKEEPGFVLAINAEWGFGKTFMMERWKQQLLSENHPVVFFDAWQNDFTEEPLMAFIAELDAGLEEYFKQIKVRNIVTTAIADKLKTLWKPIVTMLGFAAVKHLAGISGSHLREIFRGDGADDEATDSSDQKKNGEFESTGKRLKQVIEKTLADHKSIKNSIVDFKAKLSKLIEELGSAGGVQLPLIIFVDELDRCRPDYAIQLLEGIKHLFGVPGVFFVVATNIQQLGESVKAIYGAGFDGQRYLKRFFDLQYTLREPSKKEFATSLVREMVLPDSDNLIYVLASYGTATGAPLVAATSEEALIFVIQKYADVFDLSLRDQRQVGTILEAAFLSLCGKQIHIFFLVFLAVIYQINQVMFSKIKKTPGGTEVVEFLMSYEKNGFGKIDTRNQHYSGHNESNFSIITIAKMYLTVMQITVDEKNSRRENEKFPSNLLNNVIWNNKDGICTADYVTYFSGIQHAGGFAVK